MVDRRQVYEPRGFQLRRTNPSSGLTLFFTQWEMVVLMSVQLITKICVVRILVSRIPGACSGGVTPVPIPNTEVKPSSADGTYWATSWESRPVPGLNYKSRYQK